MAMLLLAHVAFSPSVLNFLVNLLAGLIALKTLDKSKKKRHYGIWPKGP